MRHLKYVGLVTVAMVVLSAYPGTASATVLTSPKDWTLTSTVRLTSELSQKLVLHTSVDVECSRSWLEANIKEHGKDITTKAEIYAFKFEECGNNHVTVKKGGTLEVHSLGNGNGTVTSTGAEISVQVTSLGITCVFTTSSTHIGTLTGSANTEKFTATLHMSGTKIPRTGGSIFCGSSGELTANYEVEVPMTLYVD